MGCALEPQMAISRATSREGARAPTWREGDFPMVHEESRREAPHEAPLLGLCPCTPAESLPLRGTEPVVVRLASVQEPVSGFVTDVQQRIQINLMLNYNTKGLFAHKEQEYKAAGARYGDISRYDITGNCSWTGICGKMKEGILFPAVWFNQRGYMTKAGADMIKKNAAYQKLIEEDLPLMGPILGIVFIGAGIFLTVVNKKRSHIWVGFQRKTQDQDRRRKTISDETPVESPGEASVRNERASLLRKIAVGSE
ncbi:hypothetical protein CYMTET_31904 [Cymbomonas tetramitiformis]|uniref:Uncharacterized protein n=1 Tax=Cymbomonas tetramitiformis TaxID=36881 RepID=A0AAE0FGH5_9CHLO|nr:hypothetical protein CYMTET_31904 [Cymbomonas tetramitiformis]